MIPVRVGDYLVFQDSAGHDRTLYYVTGIGPIGVLRRLVRCNVKVVDASFVGPWWEPGERHVAYLPHPQCRVAGPFEVMAFV